METAPIRYAVVGLGNIAQVAILPAFTHAKKNSRLVALVSSDPTKLAKLGRKYKIKNQIAYADFEAFARTEAIDAVYIALPNHLHCEWTERAADLGLHVLCEKPMAVELTECQRMIEAVERNRVKLMIAYRLHFEKANLTVLELLRKKRIGAPKFVMASLCHEVRRGDIRTQDATGGGAIYDLGVYCINTARHVFAAEPIEVAAFVSRDAKGKPSSVDETTVVNLRFPGECFAQFTISQQTAGVSFFRVVGSGGDILLDPAYDYAGPLKLTMNAKDKARRQVFAKRDQFAPELLYFSDCILKNRSPETGALEGMADVRVVRAALESAASGTVVRLDRFETPQQPSLGLEIYRPAVAKQKTIHAPSPSV